MGLSSASNDPPGLNKKRQSVWENENLSQIPFKVFRGHDGGVTSCQFFSKGKKILSTSQDGTVVIRSADHGDILQTYTGHSLPVTRGAISENDNNTILSSSWDKSLRAWDVETGKIKWQSQHDGIVIYCDISNDAKLAVSASDFDNSIRIWDMRDGTMVEELVEYHDSMPTSCVFSPNSQRVATTSLDRTTKIFDLLSKRTTVKLSGHKNIVSSCCFASNERYLCTTSWDKSLQVWDISTGMFRSQGPSQLTKGHDGSVSCCQFTSDGQQIISGGYDNSIVVWEMQNKSKKLVLKGHDGWVTGVDVSADGKWILSSSEDKTVRIWNIEAADHIPAVIENRRAMGLKIVKCEQCSKPFSIAQAEDPLDISMCVFCRLADPSRNQLPPL